MSALPSARVCHARRACTMPAAAPGRHRASPAPGLPKACHVAARADCRRLCGHPRVIEGRQGRWMLDAPPITGSDYKAIAFDKRLPHGAFHLWHILRDYAGKKKSCWPGQRRLCRDLGSNFETVARWRDQLIQCGWLQIRSGKGGRHVYTIGNFSTEDARAESGSATKSGSTSRQRSLRTRLPPLEGGMSGLQC